MNSLVPHQYIDEQTQNVVACGCLSGSPSWQQHSYEALLHATSLSFLVSLVVASGFEFLYFSEKKYQWMLQSSSAVVFFFFAAPGNLRASTFPSSSYLFSQKYTADRDIPNSLTIAVGVAPCMCMPTSRFLNVVPVSEQTIHGEDVYAAVRKILWGAVWLVKLTKAEWLVISTEWPIYWNWLLIFPVAPKCGALKQRHLLSKCISTVFIWPVNLIP